MMRIVGCVALAAAMVALQQHGAIPTWLAATVGILAMVTATVLLALEEIE